MIGQFHSMADDVHHMIRERSPDNLMTAAPESFHEAIAWLTQLDVEQFGRIWPALVVDLTIGDLTVAECPKRMLSLILDYVRARYEYESLSDWRSIEALRAGEADRAMMRRLKVREHQVKRKDEQVLIEQMRILEKELRSGLCRDSWKGDQTMPVKVSKRGRKYRLVESSGRIATTHNGRARDGGGHRSKDRADRQARAINSKR